MLPGRAANALHDTGNHVDLEPSEHAGRRNLRRKVQKRDACPGHLTGRLGVSVTFKSCFKVLHHLLRESRRRDGQCPTPKLAKVEQPRRHVP